MTQICQQLDPSAVGPVTVTVTSRPQTSTTTTVYQTVTTLWTLLPLSLRLSPSLSRPSSPIGFPLLMSSPSAALQTVPTTTTALIAETVTSTLINTMTSTLTQTATALQTTPRLSPLALLRLPLSREMPLVMLLNCSYRILPDNSMLVPGDLHGFFDGHSSHIYLDQHSHAYIRGDCDICSCLGR